MKSGKHKCEQCNYATEKISDYKNHLKSAAHINYFHLDVKSLCALCKVEYVEGDIGLSLEQSLNFFQKFNLDLVAVNMVGDVIYEYKSEENSRLSPRTLHILVHNNHCEKLTCDHKSYQQILSSICDSKEIQTLNHISSCYPFESEKESKKEKKQELIKYINNIDDVVQHIKNNPDVVFKFKTNSNINLMLFDVVKRQYIPEVKFSQNQVKIIRFKINGIKYSISKSVIEDDTEHQITEHEEEKYTAARKTFNDWLINKNFLSRSSDQTGMIEEMYKNGPVKGYLVGDYDNHKNKSYNGIDRNKSYPSLLMKMKYFPVFNEL